jgi:N-acetyl-anhydromuramoyl-L-alanine amidase
MSFTIDNGWLNGVRRILSPNHDERPAGTTIDLLVIHGISLPPGEFGGGWIDALFGNCLDSSAHPYFREIDGLKVSSHLLIYRTGEICQFVPFHLRAWHAGESCYEGRSCCNDFSIGIELEGCDDMPYEDKQYSALATVIKVLMSYYPEITPQRIAGHSDISPGRKTDPGESFDRERLYDSLKM